MFRSTIMFLISVVIFLYTTTITVNSFQFKTVKNLSAGRIQPKMEYIPDGLTKKQWEEMKKKDEEELKKKNFAAMGVTKFKSRAFEAWQKSGSGHLFPVDPSVPVEARPYMQRIGGSADGEDLKKKGLQPKDQAKPSAKNEADEKYEQLEKEGKLWGMSLPWTAEATKNLAKTTATEKAATAKASSKTVSSNKGGVKTAPAAPVEPPKKKGLFGLF